MKKIIFKHIVLFFCLMFSVLVHNAQNSKKNKIIKRQLKEAQYYLDNDNYETSWKIYRLVLISDSLNESASVNAAYSAFKLNYDIDSLLTFISALSKSNQIDAKFYLAKIKHQQHCFDEALALLHQYSDVPVNKRLHTDEETSYLVSICIHAREAIKNPHLSTIQNIGQNINSAYADYVPVLMPDESVIYFTSKREGSSNNKRMSDGTYFEDVYISHFENGNWSPAKNIGEPINTETNDACVAISPNGQKMIVYRTSADQLTGDLYVTQLGLNNQWTNLERMGDIINSPDVESSACFSNDTSEIFFSSNRPGGSGGKDLYRIKKLPNGLWSTPLNLGPSVNTAYDEDAPFLHPDGVSLYYSSKGHNTMGNYDVFKSVWDIGTNNFSQAENLGYPINDVGNDIFFVLSADGKRAYYSSKKKDTYGDVDIYKIDTRFNENDLSVEEGFVSAEGLAIRAKITLKEKGNDKETGIFYSNALSGRFIIILNPFKTYVAEVEAENCETLTVEIKPLEMDALNHYLMFKLKKSNAQ